MNDSRKGEILGQWTLFLMCVTNNVAFKKKKILAEETCWLL